MKQIARMISVSMLLLMCSVVMMAKSADDIVVVANVENGTITASVNGQECTLTVTPAQGYYIRMSDITVRKTISPALMGARAMSSEPKNVPIASDLTLSGDDPADLSAERQYTFTVPEGYDGAYVTATFMARKALTDAMVMYIDNQPTYTGDDVTPIKLMDGDKELIEEKDYTIVYRNNVDATGGDAPAEATITGKSEYIGSLNQTFDIAPALITSVEWGDDPKNPTVMCGSKELVKDTDYDVEVELRKVTVTGKGNYTNGSDTFEHPISAFDGIELADCNYTVTPITTSTPGKDSYLNIWEDTPIKPTVVVSYSADDVDIEFVEGTDYTVTIVNHSSSEPVEKITGPGIYNLVVKETVGLKRQYSLFYEVKAYTMSFADDQAWAAYCSDLNLSLPEGVTAYVITGIGETEATAAQIDYIPANTAVLLHREESETAADFTATAYSGTAQTPPTNLLKVAAEVKEVGNAEIYVLYKNEFVLASAGNLPAGRVYLPVSAVPEETSGEDTDSRLLIVIDDEATAIENRQLPTANRSADSWYSLDGRRLDGQPAGKGVYIYKGKKVKM